MLDCSCCNHNPAAVFVVWYDSLHCLPLCPALIKGCPYSCMRTELKQNGATMPSGFQKVGVLSFVILSHFLIKFMDILVKCSFIFLQKILTSSS